MKNLDNWRKFNEKLDSNDLDGDGDNIEVVDGSKVFVIHEDLRIEVNGKNKKFKLKNGLSYYLSDLKVSNRGAFSEDVRICYIDNNAKFSGVVGVFSNYALFEQYHSKYINILELYSEKIQDTTLNKTSVERLISKEIVEFIEKELYQYKSSSNNDKGLMNIHSFVSLFLNRNFSKQIHLNIMASLSFMNPSNMSEKLVSSIREYHLKND